MRNKLEDRLAAAVRRVTPNKLDDILEKCGDHNVTDITIELGK